MPEQSKPATPPPAQPKEQNPLKWLIGMKETEDERKARELRESREKASRAAIDNAIKGGVIQKKK